MNLFQLDILTPREKIFSGEAKSMIAPGEQGVFQVLAGHAPFLSSLKEGEVIVTLSDDTEKKYSISTGIFDIVSDKATLLLTDEKVDK